jgi:hypothetical protein
MSTHAPPQRRRRQDPGGNAADSRQQDNRNTNRSTRADTWYFSCSKKQTPQGPGSDCRYTFFLKIYGNSCFEVRQAKKAAISNTEPIAPEPRPAET